MERKYYKEQQHNYMVIRNTEDESGIGYQQKMLEQVRVEYLIPAGRRTVDGREYSYYDITSRLTLRQLFGSRCLGKEDIHILMTSIRYACDEIDRYLLDARRLCLDPDLIMYSYGQNRYSFVYNVSTCIEENSEGIRLYMDYLLERVDPNDVEANDVIYGLYDYYEKGATDVWDLLNAYDRLRGDAFSQSGTDEDIRPDPGERYTGEQLPGDSDYYVITPDNDDSDNVHNETGRPDAFTCIMMIGGVLGLLACGILYFFIYMTSRELMILASAAAVSGAALLYGGLRLYVSAKKKTRAAMENEIMSDDISILADGPAAYDTIRPVPMKNIVCSSDPGKEKTGIVHLSLTEETDSPEDGQTVFFDERAVRGNYKLYALDRKNKQHIELDSFPCTIGKLAGYVDRCIDDPSVSRLHARVDREDDRLILYDLNSTNGVYLNGIRLSPNEHRQIEVGDEIRFGSLTYCLRYV